MHPVKRGSKVTLQVCLEQDEYDRLTLLAVANQRTMSNMARIIISNHVEAIYPSEYQGETEASHVGD